MLGLAVRPSRLFFTGWFALCCVASGCTASGHPAKASREEPPQALATDQRSPDFWPKPPVAASFQPSSKCAECHREIVAQHALSSHEGSWVDPVFLAQYTKEVLPRVSQSNDLAAEARRCTACHAPVAFVQNRYTVVRPGVVDPAMSGVTCDVCHTISGYEGTSPQNGNYISAPGPDKLGPYRHGDHWHHVYSRLQTRSEVCGVCHNAVNHGGLEVKSTYTEWRESRFAAEGVQCQDCHMTTVGFLVEGNPVYESGRAAPTWVGDSPERAKLFTHRFPGAHSRTQLVGALKLSIEPDREVASRGDEVVLRILVDNSRTGHKMPSGSADLRQLWLLVEVRTAERRIPVAAASKPEAGGYDVAGQGKFDRQILGNDIPPGSRLYRSIFVDARGRQTLRSYEAVDIVFDNRLEASETRAETYHWKVPEDLRGGELTVRASLNYLATPSSFTRGLGVADAEPFEVTSTTTRIRLQ